MCLRGLRCYQMNPKQIPNLLASLAVVPSSNTVVNPYRSIARLNNLSAYLEALCSHPYSGHLLVGEAPGHRGCAITGIPFSSERVLRSDNHQFLKALLPSLTLAGDITERSATIVWQQFAGKNSVPAFWNVFPFHPHSIGQANSNRKPTRTEITAGTVYLHAVSNILKPHTVVAVGRVAESVTAVAFPCLKHVSIPHPSYRGRVGFIAGCASLNIS